MQIWLIWFHKIPMAKEKCWFGWVKRLFISETKTKAEKQPKSWRWVSNRLKLKQYRALTAPQRTLNEATEEQRRHALNVALATAAAAEAAVAAAHAATEVVWLTGAAQSYNQRTKRDQNLAAIEIQSAFRAYLARKALRALKGLVRLQAIVRGRAVRRQTMTTLKSFPSSVKMQPDVYKGCIPPAAGICKSGDKKVCLKPKDDCGRKEIKLECNKSWNPSVLSKKDVDAIWMRKQEAISKRERMMKYSYSHRESRYTHLLEESVHNKETGRRICRLQRRADAEGNNREGLEILKLTMHPKMSTGDIHGSPQVKQRNKLRYDSPDKLTLPFSCPRKSFSRSQQDTSGDDSSIPNSPSYMAATQSAKAKARSTSTPRQRVGLSETYSDNGMGYKKGLSLWSSYNGESTTSATNGKTGATRQIPVSMSRHY
ncbi:IQ domain-containing protein/DUF4005 domain-containing protein [Cephalotus follicularis]|uniref:IQ domain-containing protein/DUF4005 domain-containing protein n=1 Tax=Cephalotus follicularis TaxID=3775 RepID=A0A1Q3CNB1_CEPFO|nr:IQ domain-containing protein/DUF4005 domain-containing protein [Cephalotus follicularis]